MWDIPTWGACSKWMPVRTLWTVLPHLRDKSERGLAEPRLIPTQPSEKKTNQASQGQSRPVSPKFSSSGWRVALGKPTENSPPRSTEPPLLHLHPSPPPLPQQRTIITITPFQPSLSRIHRWKLDWVYRTLLRSFPFFSRESPQPRLFF